jgi:hypothetical protein
MFHNHPNSNPSRYNCSQASRTDLATASFSKKGTKATIGIPGTGLSYSENLSKRSVPSGRSDSANPGNTSKYNPFVGFVLLAPILWMIYKFF